MTKPIVIPSNEFWEDSVYAGLIGGAIFMMAEMLMVMMIGESPFAPPRMIAAMALGTDVLPPPATFDMGIMMTAMLIHFPLSIVYGIIAGLIVRNMALPTALGVGALFGLAIYVINFYGVASFMFEWFAMARNWVSLTSHILFGLATTWAYSAVSGSGKDR